MRLVVSNIAWTNEEEAEVAELLQSLGVKYVEIAPTKKWQDPTTQATDAEIEAYRQFWQQYDIEIVAFQSMLFNQPSLKIFGSEALRLETLGYLKKFIDLAPKFGARVMVFGSPKNRQRGQTPDDVARSIAKDFFGDLGDYAAAHNVQFCIEPNPIDYACDFVTNAQQGLEFVRSVNSSGLGLHLDIAGMVLAGDNITEEIKNADHTLKHFHISAPFLEQVEDREDIPYRQAAKALRDINYEGFVSIEMKPAEEGSNLKRVEKAVVFAQSAYNL